MKLLLADDDPIYCRIMENSLRGDFEVVVANNGDDAWHALLEKPGPVIAVLNWLMPRSDGVELCRRIRSTEQTARTYVLLVTAKSRIEDVVAGFESGADDYIVKPFHPSELRARVMVGARIVGLQHTLDGRIHQLQDALQHVHTLRRLLPICSYCKRIRDDDDYWEQVDAYLKKHSDLEFTHSICPGCYEKYWGRELSEKSEV
ncbi:MAG: response regulator [Terriglobales bacterium]